MSALDYLACAALAASNLWLLVRVRKLEESRLDDARARLEQFEADYAVNSNRDRAIADLEDRLDAVEGIVVP